MRRCADTILLSFSQQDIEQLRYERFHHPHPWVQQKMEALLLKAHGLPHHQIASITGVCENTLRSYFKHYLQGGINRLKELHFYQPRSELEIHRSSLETYFRDHPAASIKVAAARIHEMTGVKRGLTQVRKFLGEMGLKRLKTGAIPAKADVEKQRVFRETDLEPRLQEARNGNRVVYFVDAAHFV